MSRDSTNSFTDLNTDLTPVKETDPELIRGALATVHKWATDADDEHELLCALGLRAYRSNLVGAHHK